MPKLFVPFNTLNLDGAYAQTDQTGGARLTDYQEAIPGPQGTAHLRRSLSAITTPALASKCLGATSFSLQNAADVVIAGDATALYRAYSTVTATFTFSDISKVGGYSTAAGETWEFASFRQGAEGGIQHIIATNFSDHIQDIGLRGNVSTTATFSDLISSSTKPKARHLGIIGQFLVLGNTDQATSTTAALTPFRVHWSAFGNPRSFTPAAATQCDFEDLQTGGAVQKIVGGNEYGLLIQETQVQIMRYTGGTTIFDFSPLTHVPGTPIPNSVIYYGGAVYYISTQGFIKLVGGEMSRIGNNLVDNEFWDTVDQSRFQDVTVGADPYNKMIWWGYPTDATGNAKRMFGYKITDGRWARWVQTIETLSLIRQGRSSEKFIAFNTDHKLSTFTSNAPVTAIFETNAIQPVPGRRWQCNGIRPIIDNSLVGVTPTGSVTVRVMDHPMPASTPASLTAVSLNPDNYFPLRTAGRYQVFNVSLNPGAAVADTTSIHYLGIEIDYEILGIR